MKKQSFFTYFHCITSVPESKALPSDFAEIHIGFSKGKPTVPLLKSARMVYNLF